MSLVVIGMPRAGRAQVVMIGVVRNVSESETWVPNQGVQRSVVITGADFGYFFSLQNYYTQSLLNTRRYRRADVGRHGSGGWHAGYGRPGLV